MHTIIGDGNFFGLKAIKAKVLFFTSYMFGLYIVESVEKKVGLILRSPNNVQVNLEVNRRPKLIVG